MKIYSKNIFLLLFVLLYVNQIIAQGPPPPPPPPGLDVSGGAIYLVIAGILFGINKLKK